MFDSRAMPPVSSPSQSAEDYLERIHELIEEKGYARVVDIASSLKVRQASVTSMVQKLDELGYLKYEKYRGLSLTNKGREVARRIRSRHETLSRFFSLFGLDTEIQRRDIEGIEHHLSPATLEFLADLAAFFEENPERLKQELVAEGVIPEDYGGEAQFIRADLEAMRMSAASASAKPPPAAAP